MITERLAALVEAALAAAAAEGIIEPGVKHAPEFERPRKREHGDWATNVALIASQGKGNPRKVAEALVDRLPPSDLVERVDARRIDRRSGGTTFVLSGKQVTDGRPAAGSEVIDSDGTVSVPTGPGLGVTYDWAFIAKQRTKLHVFE